MKNKIFTLMVGTAVLAMSPAFAMDPEVSKGSTKIQANPSHAEDAMTFPKPSGQYSVGYENFEFTDEIREDPYNPGHNRKLKVTVWYPSRDALNLEPYGLEESKFYERDMSPELEPSDLETFMEQVNRLKFYKSMHAIPVQEKFPVLLFEHGFGVTAGSYQSLFQELVSNGYIVVATHHPYAADVVIFQDGSEALLKAERNNTVINTCMDDIPFVLSSLDKMEPLAHLMDLEKIGMGGHSLGGLTTMKVARVDTRIKAALQLDAPMNTSLSKLKMDPFNNSDFDMPFFHLFADDEFKHDMMDDDDDTIIVQSKEEVWNDFNAISMTKNNFKAIIRDTAHNSFADHVLLKDMLPFVKEKGWTFGAGKNDGLKINRIIAPLIRSFFDRFLKNQTAIDLMGFNDEDIHIETAK